MTLVDRLACFVFGRLLPKWPYPVLAGPLRGGRFILGAAAGAAGGVFIHLGRAEVEQTRRLATILKPGQTFFDVGANVGYYSLIASRLVGPSGRVFSFEPVPRNVAFLYRHVTLNHAANVTILPWACSQSMSLEQFDEGDNCAVGHLTAESSTPNQPAPASSTFVATVSLDGFAARFGLRPDVIKIDVEGAELIALRGGRDVLTQARPTILLSVHSSQLRTDCVDHLRRIGYRVGPLDNPAADKANEFVAEHEDKPA